MEISGIEDGKNTVNQLNQNVVLKSNKIGELLARMKNANERTLK